MSEKRRKLLPVCIMILSLLFPPLSVRAEEEGPAVQVTAPSYVLMEPETGTVICEKEKDTRRSPASVTKIMTLLLIFDHLENGSLKLEDTVTTSAHAKSMGGSQVFLEEGETQTVETMIKCIVVASGNDASVAMAEHVAGSEPEFVKQMNERAAGLGMKNTHFEDCCGLTDSDNHYTTAYDIALMSRELINKYPKVLEYSSIWMENITHVTRQGSKEFGLTNTNRLVRTYDGCVGLKTGSTSKAKFCLSAVAERNGISLISVVMAAPDSKTRQRDAAALLDYGFARCSLYTDEEPGGLPELAVKKGVESTVPLEYEGIFRYLDTEGRQISDISKKRVLPSETEAPVQKGEKAGELVYYRGGEEIGRIGILYGESVKKAKYADCLEKVLKRLWL
ncbi:MAG TPA: D-alanyl-D-alanine carboxypeptidase [Candidatus Blautia faecipullorum]|nr:D-alanyl-D-alanine carboxypeptidase [Candidatus Blautia faecipullorum]